MILTCFWCEEPFDKEPNPFPLYDTMLAGGTGWIDLCSHCLNEREPSVPQLIHKLQTDPLIYAMEKAIDAK